MDGVIYHGNNLLPGAKEFVNWLKEVDREFLFLTNSSERSPRELAEKLARLGIEVEEDHFYTSALATASFLSSQCPNGSAFVIGENGLTKAIYDEGFSMNNIDPDYVIVGETRTYNIEKIELAVHLVVNGAKLIGTNSDLTGPSEKGIIPATRALMAPIELTTGKQAYYIGKPNPLMMREAMLKLGCTVEETMIIGDRMDTDIVAGIESGIDTALVLSGVTSREGIDAFPYSPKYVFEGVGDLINRVRNEVV
ncbi:MAG: TIGR01457 family HAD-type hydrolase [Firmicutes bacterium HGW-Firmicutes-7]|nr:MAG: TIGR01457 family HAD-type hydrolase [Firmicutes bacterium HGW-Firmicutes-7]